MGCQVRGRENINLSASYVFAINHTSMMDAMLLCESVDNLYAPPAKKEIAGMPVLSRLIKYVAVYVICYFLGRLLFCYTISPSSNTGGTKQKILGEVHYFPLTVISNSIKTSNKRLGIPAKPEEHDHLHRRWVFTLHKINTFENILHLPYLT